MDRERFDTLARLLATTGSRRATLGAVLGGFLLSEANVLAKDGRRKGKRRGKDRRSSRNTRRKQHVLQAEATGCCSGGRCLLRPGQNLFKCCFEDAELAGQNLKGANLGSANFARATLTNANFSGANLDRTCLVDADVRGARFGGANTGTSILCRTKTDAGEDNSGCDRGTLCCPTCDDAHPCEGNDFCCNGRCRSGDCCDDSECTDPEAPFCVRNRCSPCTTNRQCGSGMGCCDGGCIVDTLCCDGDPNTCADPGECRVNGCDANGNCAPGQVSDVPCTTGGAPGICCDGTCEAASSLCGGICGNRCDPATQTCCGDDCVTADTLCGGICGNVCESPTICNPDTNECICLPNGSPCPAPVGNAGCCGGGCRNVFGSRFCCTASGRECSTPEQCCSGGCDFTSDFTRKVCG
jgi:hypothetical protein